MRFHLFGVGQYTCELIYNPQMNINDVEPNLSKIKVKTIDMVFETDTIIELTPSPDKFNVSNKILIDVNIMHGSVSLNYNVEAHNY